MYQKFPVGLESFPDSLDSFLTVWNVSRQCGKFPYSSESLQQSEKFPDSLGDISFLRW